MFNAVSTRSSADVVYDQVAEEIFAGNLAPGTRLPGERELASQLAVSRSVVREALQRLAHSGLVEVRQGGATRVRDYQDSSDLGLLNRLIIRADGTVNADVVRSILQARIAIGMDAARLCATLANPDVAAELTSIVDAMSASTDTVERQRLDLTFWECVVIGSQNVVYRLAYNGLAATYRPIIDVITAMVEPEIADLATHRKLIGAIAAAAPDRAQRAALTVLTASNAQWDELLTAIEEEGDQ